MIEIKNLHKSYRRGKEIIPDLNLKLGETGLTMIVGKSGCGKTTLLNIIGAMDLDFQGQVIVDGMDLQTASYKQIVDYRNFTSAFVFQKNSLFEFLTVEENLKLCMNIQNNTASISEALEKVGLKGFEHKKVKSLSGGEKQRVAIARALIKNCKIIFADEPTSALDTKNAHKIFQLFKDISKDKLVVLVTHDIKKSVLYADRIIRFVDGVPVEDTTYNQVTEQAKVLPPRKTKKFALVPIFKNHLKKGLIINLFITLLLVAAITVTSLAIAGTKVKNEYDYYGTTEQTEFNVDRAVATQIKNNINLFNVVKNGEIDSPYAYLANAINGNNKLTNVDKVILNNELKDYNVYLGTNDSLYNKLVIDTISKQTTLSQQASSGYLYWDKIFATDYIYYLYDETNDYNILEGGRLPNTNNEEEILVSDVVAWHYLNKDNTNGNFEGDPNDANAYANIYNVDFVIYDTYGTYDDGNEPYYIGTPKHYKVVGVIYTGLLKYYTFDKNTSRYVFNGDFKTQDNDRYATFMNSVSSQPFGYVVLQQHLQNSINNPFLYNSFTMDNIKMSINNSNYTLTTKSINAFIGKYDYTTNPAEMYDREKNNMSGTHKQYQIAGYEDNLKIDHSKQLLALSTTKEELQDNEIIISRQLASMLFPELTWTVQYTSQSFEQIKNQEITMQYNNGYNTKEITVKIVGISNQKDDYFYVSNQLFTTLYSEKYMQAETMTVDLQGVNAKERKKLMEKLYQLGYSLSPVDVMPGAYLEFVDGKGETYAEVDGEGLQALYPNHEIRYENNEYYFVNDDLVFGVAEVSKDENGEMTVVDTVYMTSTMVKKIALDDSYIIKNLGNLSPYYLFSDYYTFDSTNTGNYILEILSSMYMFLLGMATLLAIGFIYLKENKEKDTMTKLSMLGVRPIHIYLIHLITYFAICLIIALLSIGATYIFVNIINNLFTYSFDSGATIYRIRLMFETSAIEAAVIISLIFFALSMVSSIFVTYRSRK